MPTQARPDPLKLAVCDDEAADRARIEQMAGAILREESIAAEIAGYDSAAALRAGHEDAAIIFISSNREMALRGYEVAASRYLAKPVDPEKLREALLHCRAARSGRTTLVLPTASGQSSVAPAAVLYAEAWERGVRLHLDREILEVRLPLSQVAAMLPEGQFACCHRTLLVNLAQVRHVRYCELELKNGERLPISKYRLAQFKSEFLKYLRD